MSHHHSILQEVIESSSVEDSLVRSYGRSFNNFAAISVCAIGSFHAMTKGNVTTVAVRNDGSKLGLASNLAPWLISVAAGTTDQIFVTDVVNGDGKTVHGRSINDCTEELARGCMNTVQGKIVVCDVSDNDILLVTDVDSPGLGPIPVTTLDDTNYDAFRSYVLSSTLRQLKDNNAPIVASSSSHGPNTLFSDILCLKTLIAPGVNILAAYSPLGQTALPGQSVDYYFMSGTSMACPHVAGVVPYIKTFHPDWSASSVKSAIMTTGIINIFP
ncbi:hypothetical protein N665_0982s0013 [Sinapis alba]|nr:hypothetical protein N665_0982s0013 [Sinapis alba]